MELYILSKEDLSIQSVSKLADYQINLDEETNGKSIFTLVKCKGLQEGNFIVINGLFKQFLFVIPDGGIETEKGSNLATVTALDISNIFDRKIIEKDTSMMTTDSIEKFLANTISENFVNSDDPYINKSYIDVYWHTNTKATVNTNAENGLYNFHTFLINCRQSKNICTDFKFRQKIKESYKTVTGKEILIEDGENNKGLEIKVKGLTTQSTRSGKNIFNKKAKIIENGVTKSVLDTGVRITQTHAGKYRYGGIRLGGSELLGKTLRISANWTKSADNVPYIAIYLGNSSSMALYSLFGTGVSGQIIQITIPNAFPAVGEQVCDTVFILLYSNRDGTGNVGDYVDYTDLIVTIDNEDMSYEDYGVSPSPDYPSEIENVEGKNKLDYKTVSNTPNTVVSLIENGFNVNGMYAGKVIVDNLKKNTNYYLQYLTENIAGALKQVNIFAGDTQTNTLKAFNNSIGGIFNTGENTKINIWFYANNKPTTTGEANFTNIQLEEGTVATDYVPYNSLEIKDRGENLLDLSKCQFNGCKIGSDGKSIISNISNNYYCELITTQLNDYLLANKGKTLTFLTGTLLNKATAVVIYGTRTNGSTYQEVNEQATGKCSITVADDFTTITAIRLRFNRQSTPFTDTSTTINYAMLVLGAEEIPYKQYQEQKVTFPLVEGQKLMKGSYLASDGIHNKRKQVILDGSERWVVDKELTNTIRFYSNEFLTKGKSVNALCNYFETVSSAYTINTVDKEALMVINTTQIAVRINKTRAKTVSEFKAYLSEQYSNGTPVIVEYELAAEEIVPYTTEQQEAWDKIESMKLYDGVNHIESTAELDIKYNYIYPENAKIIIDIENKEDSTALIDTTLAEVTDYNKVYEADYTAKVQVLIREDNSVYNLYLKTDRTTTEDKNDINRATGKVETISVDTKDKAKEEALNVMKGNTYKHLVEFKIAKSSKLIDISKLYIGRKVRIKTEDDIYDSYISAITLSDENFVYFKSGNLRIDLLDKLKKKENVVGNKLDVSGGKILGNLDIDGTLQLGGKDILGQTILWDNYYYMNASQTVNVPISEQKHGVMLMFCAYSNGQPHNWNWANFVILKKEAEIMNGAGRVFPMGNAEGIEATKYIYIYSNKLEGNDKNQQGNSANYVLRKIIGF